jgi:hypothetical protein
MVPDLFGRRKYAALSSLADGGIIDTKLIKAALLYVDKVTIYSPTTLTKIGGIDEKASNVIVYSFIIKREES